MQPRRAAQGICLSCAAACLFCVSQGVLADSIPKEIADAVADPVRPAADRERDTSFRPAEALVFAGAKPGDNVAELMPGDGYFTRILCRTVGASGHVYAIGVAPQSNSIPDAQKADSLQVTSPQSSTTQPTCTNVSTITLRSRNFPAPELHSDSDDPGWVYEYYAARLPIESFFAPEPLDTIWLCDIYRALRTPLFGSPNMQWVNTAFLMALKSGGVLVVADSAAQPGSEVRDEKSPHRIEIDRVKRELLSAGFIFAGEYNIVDSANDARNAVKSQLHGTDRFLLKFRKP